MPIDHKIRDIIRLLLRLTEQDLLTWSTTPDEETFRASLPQGVVRVAKFDPTSGSSVLAPGEDSYFLTLLDNEGRLIEQHRATEPEEVQELSYLHTRARRSALKTDDFLDSVLRELDRRVGNRSAS